MGNFLASKSLNVKRMKRVLFHRDPLEETGGVSFFLSVPYDRNKRSIALFGCNQLDSKVGRKWD